MSEEKFELSKQKHWVFGIAVALLGVVCSRVIAPQYVPVDYRTVAVVIGHFISLGGIFIIARGIYKKHSRGEE